MLGWGGGWRSGSRNKTFSDFKTLRAAGATASNSRISLQDSKILEMEVERQRQAQSSSVGVGMIQWAAYGHDEREERKDSERKRERFD